MFARGTAAEIVTGNKNLRIAIGWFVQHEIRIVRAIFIITHLGKQPFAQAGALDGLEVVLRDDHVGIDIDDGEGGCNPCQLGELFHCLPAVSLSFQFSLNALHAQTKNSKAKGALRAKQDKLHQMQSAIFNQKCKKRWKCQEIILNDLDIIILKALKMAANHRPRRSVLYIPALNVRALAKIPMLNCDSVIIDLEDSIAPSEKEAARQNLKASLKSLPAHKCELVIRINSLHGEWGKEDLAVARHLNPSAILLPKVESAGDIMQARELLSSTDAAQEIALWAMIETPRGILSIAEIAMLGRDERAGLACFVAGTNDLIKETGVQATPDRRWLTPWLLQIVLAARAGGIDALDGVSNDFSDLEAFCAECGQGRDMGFDGKTLIHPAQIAPANEIFSPDQKQLEEAIAIREAFAMPENQQKGVISLNGKMVERLHLDQAEKLIAKAGK